MKISKRQSNIKANSELTDVTVAVEPLAPACPPCKYDNAINLISAAIESLAEVARDDEIAKDSIANLGVVMLDLKGGCSC